MEPWDQQWQQCQPMTTQRSHGLTKIVAKGVKLLISTETEIIPIKEPEITTEEIIVTRVTTETTEIITGTIGIIRIMIKEEIHRDKTGETLETATIESIRTIGMIGIKITGTMTAEITETVEATELKISEATMAGISGEIVISVPKTIRTENIAMIEEMEMIVAVTPPL